MKTRTFTIVVGLVAGLAGSSFSFADGAVGTSVKEDSAKADAGTPPLQHSPVPLLEKQQQPGQIERPALVPPSALRDIQLSFKLDPRLTRSLYMGERWVSPTNFTRVGEGKECIVETRAYGLNARGKAMKISPKWISADLDTVSVSPAEGNDVKIHIKRPGETSLEVVSQGLTKKLSVKAVAHGDSIQVEITQHAVTERARLKGGASGGQRAKETSHSSE